MPTIAQAAIKVFYCKIGPDLLDKNQGEADSIFHRTKGVVFFPVWCRGIEAVRKLELFFWPNMQYNGGKSFRSMPLQKGVKKIYF
jgi:hypothetical protein